MTERTCRIGVHGRNDTSFTEDDYRVIKDSRVEAVKMMSQTEPAVFQRIKSISPDIEIITRLHDDRIHHGHPTPSDFVEKMVPVMQTLQPYCAKYQVANEPNHAARYEGWGPDDADAQDFNEWFLEVCRLLKQACPWASIGFPGLAVPDFAHRDRAWLSICRPAIERADWLGVHCYWQTPTDRPSVMFDESFGLTFKYYHSQFPDKRLEILECGNSNIHNPAWPISQDDVAREYVAWLQEVFRYPYVNSVAFFLLSSPDQKNWDFFTWRTENNFVKPVAHAIRSMNRPKLLKKPLHAQPDTAAAPVPEPTAPATPREESSATAVPRMDGRFTNNQIIDAFYDASVKLGLGDWTLMGKAGLSLGDLAGNRTGSYTGPSLEQIGSLTGGEREALQLELAEFVSSDVSFGPGQPEPVGLLWRRADLATVRPALPEEMQVPLSTAENGLERRVLRIWNECGWLLLRLSEMLQVQPAVAVAVLAVYGGDRAFGGDGRLSIRFEPHIFYDKWGVENEELFSRSFRFRHGRPWQKHEWRLTIDQPWREVHATRSDEWGAFSLACDLDEDAALLATGMGAAQIMGFNHREAGFESAGQMYDAFRASVRNQILGFFDFIGDPGRFTSEIQCLQAADLEAFAAQYSGADQAARYAPQLRSAAAAFRSRTTIT